MYIDLAETRKYLVCSYVHSKNSLEEGFARGRKIWGWFYTISHTHAHIRMNTYT